MKLMCESKTPHFFQIIIAKTLQLGKLEVPDKFVREYGKSLASRSVVLLKVPSGDEWTVEVVKKRNKSLIFFGYAWEEFMEHYSLDIGSFMLFEHEGQSVFMVSIFDISSTEIDYPLKLNPGQFEEENPAEGQSEWLNVEDLLGESLGGFGEDKMSKRNKAATAEQSKASCSHKKRANVRSGEEEEANQSEHPSFRLRIQPSYLIKNSKVNLPAKFFKENNCLKDTPMDVTFRVGGSRKITWTTRLHYRANQNICEFRGCNDGWGKFARDVGLCEGDECKLELTKRKGKEVFFNVSISKPAAS